jgi:hypothetical protein
LPAYDLDCCRVSEVSPNGFGQIEVETIHYSVPTNRAAAKLRVKPHPFTVEIYRPDEKEALTVTFFKVSRSISSPGADRCAGMGQAAGQRLAGRRAGAER